MKDRREQGWNRLGNRLSDYRPSGDVDAGYEALTKLRQTTSAPATSAPAAWSYGGFAKLTLLVLGALTVLFGLYVFSSDGPLIIRSEDALASTTPRPSTGLQAPDAGSATTSDEAWVDDSSISTNGRSYAAAGSSIAGITTIQPGGVRDNTPSTPDENSFAHSPAALPLTTTATIAAVGAQRTPGREPIEALAGWNATPGAPRSATTATAELRSSVVVARLPTAGWEPTEITLISGDASARDLYAGALVKTPPTGGDLSKTRRARISLAVGRQLNVGRSGGGSLADATLHGYLEYVRPVGRRFGAGLRLGFSGYGGYQETNAETVRTIQREFISPLGRKVSFNQIEYADLVGSLDASLIATYRPAPRLTLLAGLRYSPTFYSVGIDTDGLPSAPAQLSDIARMSWSEFGGLAGLEYRVWGRFSAEVSYAPTFTRPINRVYPVDPIIDPAPYEEVDLTTVKAAVKVSF